MFGEVFVDGRMKYTFQFKGTEKSKNRRAPLSLFDIKNIIIPSLLKKIFKLPSQERIVSARQKQQEAIFRSSFLGSSQGGPGPEGRKKEGNLQGPISLL